MQKERVNAQDNFSEGKIISEKKELEKILKGIDGNENRFVRNQYFNNDIPIGKEKEKGISQQTKGMPPARIPLSSKNSVEHEYLDLMSEIKEQVDELEQILEKLTTEELSEPETRDSFWQRLKKALNILMNKESSSPKIYC